MPEPNQTCGTCIFWRRSSDQAGECRRNPPQVVVIMEEAPMFDARNGSMQNKHVQKLQGHFPLMREGDAGCGEYRSPEPVAQVSKEPKNMHE